MKEHGLQPMHSVSPLLGQVFRNLDRVQAEYCVLRRHDELLTTSPSRQVHLLLRPSHRRRFEVVVEAMGFLPWPARRQGLRRPYVAYDPEDDSWLELHVVEALRYVGCCLEVPVAGALLARRHRQGAAWMPAPEDELLTLLFHCVLEQRRFREGERRRLRALWEQLRRDREAQKRLFSFLASLFGNWPMLALVQGFDLHDWDDLLRQRRRWVSRLFLHQPLAALWRAASLLPRRARRCLEPRPGSTVLLASPDAKCRTALASALARDPWLQARVVSQADRLAADAPPLPERSSPLMRQPRRLRLWTGALQRLCTDWCRRTSVRLQALLGRTVVYEVPFLASGVTAPGRGWTAWQPDLVLLLQASTPGPDDPSAGPDSQWPEPVVSQNPHSPAVAVRQLAVLDTAAGTEAVRRAATALLWKQCVALWGKRRRVGWRTAPAPAPVTAAVPAAEGARVIS